jgi:hypothetical protein
MPEISKGIIVLEDPSKLIDWFDDFAGPNQFAFLSNFYVAPVFVDFSDFGFGQSWFATTEHAFAACKASTTEAFEDIRHAPTPGSAKARGRRVTLRHDWEDIKDDVMAKCVITKFGQHADLRERLVATGDAVLVEGTLWGDRIWGVDLAHPNRPGQNRLGKLLTHVRFINQL